MPKLDFTKQLFQDDPAEVEKDFLPAEIDATPFIEKFKKHEARILLMAKQVDELEVTDDASAEKCVAMGATASKANKELNALRTQIVKPHNDFVKTINNSCKMFTGKITEMLITPLKSKYGTYNALKEMAAKKKQEEERKAAEALQKKIDKEAKKVGVEAPQVPIPKTKPKPVGPVKTTPGTGYTQKSWTYEIEDINKVPRDFLIVDKGAVTRAIRAGKREIPGLRIFERSGVAFRTG